MLSRLSPWVAEDTQARQMIGNGRVFGAAGPSGDLRPFVGPELSGGEGWMRTHLTRTSTAPAPDPLTMHRVSGRPVIVTHQTDGQLEWQTVTFAGVDKAEVWRAISVRSKLDAATSVEWSVEVHVPGIGEGALDGRWSRSAQLEPRGEWQCFVRIGWPLADSPFCGQAEWLAAGAAVDRAWSRRTSRALEVRSAWSPLDHLIADSGCDLLIQQDRVTGAMLPMLGDRVARPEDSAGAILGLLRLGFWDEAARVLESWGPVAEAIDAGPILASDPDALWLVLAHYWHARAADDLRLVDAHWGFLTSCIEHSPLAPNAAREQAMASSTAERVLYAMAIQAMGALEAMRAGPPDAPPSDAAIAWLRHYRDLMPWVDAALADPASGDPFFAPWLGHFPTGALHDTRIAEDLRRHPPATCTDSDTLARMVVALSQAHHPQRDAAWHGLVRSAGRGGMWGSAAAGPSPGQLGRAIDAVACGLMGARTPCWGPTPGQVLPLHLFLPTGLPWWRARNVARDGWRVHVIAEAEERALSPAERQALAAHPELGDAEALDRHRLMRGTVHLASENPARGAWQASVTMFGTSFQRYLSRENPVDELELWRPGVRAPWPVAGPADRALPAPPFAAPQPQR